MNKRIKLLKDIEGCFNTIFKKDSIHIEDEPYSGFNEDGTFTICQGMDLFTKVNKEDYEIIKPFELDVCIKHKSSNHLKLRNRKIWYFYTENKLKAIEMFEEYFYEHYDPLFYEYKIY